MLKAALQYSGLEEEEADALDDTTVWAPTNPAFEELFENLGVRGLVFIDPVAVAAVLATHVITDDSLDL